MSKNHSCKSPASLDGHESWEMSCNLGTFGLLEAELFLRGSETPRFHAGSSIFDFFGKMKMFSKDALYLV